MTIFTEKEDLLTVFNYIQRLEYVNPEQIFLFGGSQGGFVTSLAAEELEAYIKANKDSTNASIPSPGINIDIHWRAVLLLNLLQHLLLNDKTCNPYLWAYASASACKCGFFK